MPLTETPLAEIERLRQERADDIDQMKSISERADREKRDLRPDEAQRFDRLGQRCDDATDRIKHLEERHGYGPKLTHANVAPITGPGRVEENRSLALGAEQRMVDWAAQRDRSGFASEARDFPIRRNVAVHPASAFGAP